MSDANSQQLGLLPKLVIGLGALLIVAGVLWYGITMEIVFRILRNLVTRPSDPMRFRFILQPAMAVIVAIHDGIKDAKAGRSPYFWTMLSKREKRAGRLREGLNATARIILLGIAIVLVERRLETEDQRAVVLQLSAHGSRNALGVDLDQAAIG